MILDRKPPPYETGKTVIQHDISRSLDSAFGLKIDHVIHLAAMTGVKECRGDPERAFEVNVKGTRNVLEFCRSNDADMVFTSTFAVYAEPTFYSATKIAGEWLCRHYTKAYKVRTVILRCANIYGPNFDIKDKLTVVPLFILSALRNRRIPVEGSGNQTRDFIYVEDICSAIIKALEYSSSGIFDIGTSVRTSINRLAEMVRSYFPGAAIRHVPLPSWRVERVAEDCYPPNNFICRTEEALGFKPEVSLEEGLRIVLCSLNPQHTYL